MDDDVIPRAYKLYTRGQRSPKMCFGQQSSASYITRDHIEIQISSLDPVKKNHFGHSRICFDQGAANFFAAKPLNVYH